MIQFMNMLEIYLLHKPVGATPLESINALKRVKPELASVPLTYAGRLDPMAEGLLIILCGNAIKRKTEFLNLPKTYTATIMLGIETDSYDILGIPVNPHFGFTLNKNKALEVITELVGNHEYTLPPYASVPVHGKPLHWWARQGRLHEITIPKRIFKIDKAKLDTITVTSLITLWNYIEQAISRVRGDFRQQAILSAWRKNISKTITPDITTLEVTITCGSGTYIRSIAHELGKQIGTHAILLKLVRTSIGPYKLQDAIQLP